MKKAFLEVIRFEASDVIATSEDCLAKGTLITMADGSKKKIEEIVKGDKVLTFNHETGKFEGQSVYIVYKGDTKKCAFTLNFTNKISLSIVGDHDLFCEEELNYVRILESNASSFVGKHFFNAKENRYEELLSVSFGKEPVEYYEIYTEFNANCVAENMLNVPMDNDEIVRFYTFNKDLSANQEQLSKDIKEFGLMEYNSDMQCDKALYDAVKWKYVYILIGKGFGTREDFIKRKEILFSYVK